MDNSDSTRGIDPDLQPADDSVESESGTPEADTASGGAPDEPDTDPAVYGKSQKDS
jgi:hypothetical protein